MMLLLLALTASLRAPLLSPSAPETRAPSAVGGRGGQGVRAPPPRLVVVITVDQLRPDYLDRWRTQLTGGLGRLLAEGALFEEAYQDHAVTETAPGHSTVLSGRWPAHTDIISNDVGVLDPAAPLLEVQGPGASPQRFRGSALFDWLRASNSRARALSVSRKDRGAILPIGRSKAEVYWYTRGMFTTSRYYRSALPAWVFAFNDREPGRRYAAQPWALLLPDSAYTEPDDQPWEDPQNNYREKTFPHSWTSDSTRSAELLPARPAMDSLTLAFALEGVRIMALGQRPGTDLLAVSLSTLDAVGHTFGPDSREVHDMVLRLDRYLGWFFERLFRTVRAPDVIVALTADHGVTPYPAEARALGHDSAAAIEIDTLIAAVNAGIGGGAGFHFDSGMLFFTAGSSGPRRDLDSVIRATAARLEAVRCVDRVDRPRDLAKADTAVDAVARRWLHHVPAGAPVALVVSLRPYCVWGDETYAMHGQPSDLDARVPLILWGRGVKPGRFGGRVSTVDLAPTLARLLGIVPLERTDGRVLLEALED